MSVRSALMVSLVAYAAATARVRAVQSDILSVFDPRPLGAAVALVEKRCRCPITYEDPRYNREDAVDVSATVRRDGLTRPVWVPRTVLLTFAVDFADGDRTPSAVARALRNAVESYAVNGYPGTFSVKESNRWLQVVPEPSILQTNVTLRPADDPVSALKAIDSVLQGVSATTGTRVGIGTVPINLLMQTAVRVAAADSTADEVLRTVLASVPRPLSWRLLYDVGLERYALNIHIVD